MIPEQQIRFCSSRDGVRIAFATSGEGPPLVKPANWVSHLELDWQSLVWRPWLAELSRRHTLIRYDARGCGLSDREGVEFSFERYVEDLEAVVEAAGVKDFALIGLTGGGPTAIAYAARKPTRVSRLVLYGAFARGRIVRAANAQEIEEAQTLLKLIELGWGKDDAAFRQFVSSQLLPDGSIDQLRSYNELIRRCASPENAAELTKAWYGIDVRALAAQIRCPTLVLHPRGGFRVPFEEGRILATLIPGARFVPLESRNHMLLEQEPAWRRFVAELEDFLPAATAAPARDTELRLDELTAREREVVELVAQGLDNPTIARRLGMRDKTVRNHVSAILSKLDLHSRSEVIVRAREAGFGQSARG
jgi:pimeloyl-ACP methyl ester carboxylesterase/DNA-binding CsgD family transcriptional regulator